MDSIYITALLIGLAGGVHCVGMCGGIASSLLFSATPTVSRYRLLTAYNFGRISSYSIAGALVGYSGNMLTQHTFISPKILLIFSSILLLLLGFYIGGFTQSLTWLERVGGRFFRLIKPVSARFLPLNNAIKAIPYGMIWGWLPCGLVYSTLAWAMSSGSATNGALVMLSFGVGTLPAVFATSMSGQYTHDLFSQPLARKFIAIILIISAIALLSMALIH
ncbi:MAG: sulfite exporter TauE/SafE family protein [Glaciecola sp.]|jgi:sulfite exporter TauE/SafE|nr:sulfite exporter TauE/SafE family protein [Glaciecola sp.]MDG2098972.1 sulfite exporter TauE/SafE family protein [Glaciecola sp.]